METTLPIHCFHRTTHFFHRRSCLSEVCVALFHTDLTAHEGRGHGCLANYNMIWAGHISNQCVFAKRMNEWNKRLGLLLGMGEPTCPCIRALLLLPCYRQATTSLFRQACGYTQAFITDTCGSERMRSLPKVTHIASSWTWAGMQECLSPKLKYFHYVTMSPLYIRNLLCIRNVTMSPLRLR